MPVIGLVADTHAPLRCAELPARLFDALAGVDLVLHAGDVGELWVLDRLSATAPVVAAHGNDVAAEAGRELPYQQVVVAAGQRLLLCHGHYPNREREMASRRDDAWGPKLDRWAAMGQRADAAIVVYGHSHIPMAHARDGVLLVNPGAIASPNATTRQLRQTVARLYLDADGSRRVVHVDLAEPARAYQPEIDWSAGFRAAHDRFAVSILTPALASQWERLRPALGELVSDAVLFPAT